MKRLTVERLIYVETSHTKAMIASVWQQLFYTFDRKFGSPRSCCLRPPEANCKTIRQTSGMYLFQITGVAR